MESENIITENASLFYVDFWSPYMRMKTVTMPNRVFSEK